MMIDLNTFFKEKAIPFTQWEIEHEGQIHIIDSDFIIDCILSTEGQERHKIGSTIFSLDFRNASIVDYLKFLAECYIKHQGEMP